MMPDKQQRRDRARVQSGLGSHQRPCADGRVEAGHVHVLADAGHHPHEELQLPARGWGQQEGAELQGLHGDHLGLRLEEACTRARTSLPQCGDGETRPTSGGGGGITLALHIHPSHWLND